jgi:hypothetical protein
MFVTPEVCSAATIAADELQLITAHKTHSAGRLQHNSHVVFHTDRPGDLVVVPLAVMMELLQFSRPAQDGMFKLQITFSPPPEMRIAGAGRIGLGAYSGVPIRAAPIAPLQLPETTRQHAQVQAMLKAIGLAQGRDVWIPRADRTVTVGDVHLGTDCLDRLDVVVPPATRNVIENIDVIWLEKARYLPVAFFEVEHSTSIYSGLLRLNDVLIDYKMPHAAIVTDTDRHATYLRHVHRRTFEYSGLTDLCSHYTYDEVQEWFVRTRAQSSTAQYADTSGSPSRPTAEGPRGS